MSTVWPVVVALLFLAGIPGLVRDWRPGPITYRTKRTTIPELVPLWLASRRAGLPNEAALAGFLIGVALPDQILLAAAIVVVSFVATMTILLWNQPRWLVPPKMRGQRELAAS